MKSGDVEEKRGAWGVVVVEKAPAQQTPVCLISLHLGPPTVPQPVWPTSPLRGQPQLLPRPSSLSTASLAPPPSPPPTHRSSSVPTASFLVTMLLVVMSLTCPRDSVVPTEGPPPPHTPLSTRPRLPQIHIKNQPAQQAYTVPPPLPSHPKLRNQEWESKHPSCFKCLLRTYSVCRSTELHSGT